MRLERSHAGFDATRWSLIAALHAEDETRRDWARDLLIRRYWPPVYSWLRRSGYSRDASTELTQSFFVGVVLGRGLFDRASSERGKLRTLMLTSLQRFLIDVSRHESRRGETGARAIPLDAIDPEECVLDELASAGDELFDRRWALVMLDEALERCADHFARTGRERHWSLFEARVLGPARLQKPAPSLVRIHAEYGFRTSAGAGAAIQVVKKRLLAIYKDVVEETLESRDDTGEEYRYLISLI